LPGIFLQLAAHFLTHEHTGNTILLKSLTNNYLEKRMEGWKAVKPLYNSIILHSPPILLQKISQTADNIGYESLINGL
jgi:hypothetical protein